MIKEFLEKFRNFDRYKGEYIKYLLSEKINSWICPRYKFSEYGRVYLYDRDFFNEYRQRVGCENYRSLDRKYAMKELLKLVTHLQGDTVECGAYQGASSYFICRQIAGLNKKHLVFDSFEGLSRPNIKEDGRYWKENDLVSGEDIIRKNLSSFPFVEYYKGWIPQRFEEVASRRFCFLHIDVDLLDPTFESLKFFYPRMEKGGIILCDDYGFITCPGAKKAIDTFLSDKPEKVALLPTGQGLVIKQ